MLRWGITVVACRRFAALLHLPAGRSYSIPGSIYRFGYFKTMATSTGESFEKRLIYKFAGKDSESMPLGTIHIYKGDITTFQGDAIVNAANTRMLGGGGVDGAIHDAAGRELREGCEMYEPNNKERCAVGDAKITRGYGLPCKWVIHTVGPTYSKPDAKRCQKQLLMAYMNSLTLAFHVQCRTVAFPAISCGIYGYPMKEGAEVALKACYQRMADLEEVHLVLFANSDVKTYRNVVTSWEEEGLLVPVPLETPVEEALERGPDMGQDLLASSEPREPALPQPGPAIPEQAGDMEVVEPAEEKKVGCICTAS
eukprot:jgi/Botrbrau1/18566/Bobra.0367s0012.2